MMKNTLIIIIIIIKSGLGVAQNLVSNASFEAYKTVNLPYSWVVIPEQFDYCFKEWYNPTAATSDVLNKNYYNNDDVLLPRSGDGAVGLVTDSRKTGWYEYVQTKLTTPLTKGKYYYAEAWLSADQSEIFKGFGLLFTTSEWKKNTPYVYQAHPQIYHCKPMQKEWHKISGIFKADSAFQYLSIGYFDAFSVVQEMYVSIDDVMVREVTQDEIEKMVNINDICLSSGDNIVIPDIEFDVNSTLIRPNSTPTLLRFVELIKTYKGINIEIQGHTDADGDDAANMLLSEARSSAIANFMIENGIDKSQITAKGYGEIQPLASNQSEVGKQKNRRVSMKVLEIPNAKKAYGLAIEATRKKNFDKAFEYLRIVNLQKGIEIPMLLDADLSPLHKDKRWGKIQWFAKQRYTKQAYCEKKGIAFDWALVWYEDQIPRAGDYYWKRIKPDEYITPIDSTKKYKIMEEVKVKHLKQLEDLVKKNEGKLPYRREIGIKGFEAIFVVVQHSGDIGFMEKYLSLFKKTAEVEPIVNKDVAYLADRLELLKGKPQIYGTQYLSKNDKMVLAKLLEPQKINEKRKKMRLDPLEENEILNAEK